MKTKFKNFFIAICIYFFCGFTYHIGYQMFFDGIDSRINYENKTWVITIYTPDSNRRFLKSCEMKKRPKYTDNTITIEDSYGNIETISGFPFTINEILDNSNGLGISEDQHVESAPNSINKLLENKERLGR